MRWAAPLPSVLDPVLRTWKVLLERDPEVKPLAGAHTATSMDDTLLCDATSGAVVVTLPTAAENPGKTFTLIKTDAGANAASFVASGSDVVRGSASASTQWGSRTVRSDGQSNWIVIAET
jgi:predicted enzyme related to lactoylglutathione lyase